MLDFATYLAAIERDAALLADTAAAGFDAPVPACPGWDVGDLLEHTAIVHRHKLLILKENWTEGSPEPPAPPPRRRLLTWFRRGAQELIAELAAHDPATPISTWDAGNETVGFWYRRMAHETFIHRVDAEQAHGHGSELDADLALDGIDELLTSFTGGAPSWSTVTPTDRLIRLAPTDAERRWDVRLAALSGTSPVSGVTYVATPLTLLEPFSESNGVTATVSTSAGGLDLWLWGRLSSEALDVSGDRSAVDELRALAAESTT